MGSKEFRFFRKKTRNKSEPETLYRNVHLIKRVEDILSHTKNKKKNQQNNGVWSHALHNTHIYKYIHRDRTHARID